MAGMGAAIAVEPPGIYPRGTCGAHKSPATCSETAKSARRIRADASDFQTTLRTQPPETSGSLKMSKPSGAVGPAPALRRAPLRILGARQPKISVRVIGVSVTRIEIVFLWLFTPQSNQVASFAQIFCMGKGLDFEGLGACYEGLDLCSKKRCCNRMGIYDPNLPLRTTRGATTRVSLVCQNPYMPRRYKFPILHLTDVYFQKSTNLASINSAFLKGNMYDAGCSVVYSCQKRIRPE